MKKVLTEQFEGARISERNLSTWRQSGYQRWLERQEPYREIAALADDAGTFSRVSGDRLARGAAAIVTARILKLLRDTPPEKWTAEDLAKVMHALTGLVNAEQNNVRLEHEKMGLDLRDEQLTLSWDKHMRDATAVGLRLAGDAYAKEVATANISNEEKIELLGRHMFNEFWKGRPVAIPENSSNTTAANQ